MHPLDSDSTMDLGSMGPDSEFGGGGVKTPSRKRRRPLGEMVIVGLLAAGALMHETPSRSIPLVIHMQHVAHFERSA